ncbi:MAG: AAA family ATPase [Salipiger marinus]|uniref:AAA family ATPase n=1 Tax=Salipiger marinus TaxID=555512 RepID=UPI004058C862
MNDYDDRIPGSWNRYDPRGGDDGPPPREAPPGRASTFYSASTLKGKPVPERQWLVPGMVPQKTVTLFSGDGGTGKSLLALQMAVAAVTGGRWIGKEVKEGAALLISAEDDDDELHRRLNDILRAEGRSYDDVAGLTLRSLAGEDALLALEGQIALTETTLFRELEERAKDDAPELIVIDTLADVYPANENDRAKVRQFVGILRGLALRRRCAVVLLGHPSLTGLNSGSGTSGSTAWHNSVRSRLYLHRVVNDQGHEDDTRKRVLTVKKQNYGETGAEFQMTWQDGVFVVDQAATGLDKMAMDNKAERVFLRLLDDFTKQGRFVKSAQAQGYAPKVFAASGAAEGLSKQALHAAMERLFSKNEIVEVLGGHASPSKQTKRIMRASNAPAEPSGEGC